MFLRPSIAVVTVTAGVSVPSASKAAPPIKAGRTNHLACIDIRNGEMTRERGLELCEKYDGKRPASLDQFLWLLNISEEEFEQILLANSVIDWGFDHNNLKKGKVLSDMHLWDTEL